MWKDLSFKERAALINQWHKEHVVDYAKKKREYDEAHRFEDGGDTNSMDYEYRGTVYSDDLKNQGITHVAELPNVTVYGRNPNNYRSVFNGRPELGSDIVSMLPVAGDAYDAYNAIKAASEGSYTEAGLIGAGLLLPNVLEKPARFLMNKVGSRVAGGLADAMRKRPELVPDVTGKPHYKPEDIPDVITINRAPEGKFYHQDELKLDGDYDFTEGHINDNVGHFSPREYARQFNDLFANAKHGQAVAFLKDDDLSFDSYADVASFLAKQQQKGKIKLVKAAGAPQQMKLNGLGKNKFPNKETRADDMNSYLDRLNERYGTSFSHVTDKSEFVPYPPVIKKLQGREGWTRSSFYLDPIIAVKLKDGGRKV